jgi:N-acyl-D-amino-acid deacylase
MFDVVIKNGRIVDGSGLPGWNGSVAIADGRIAAVSGAIAGPARQVIDARGAVIAPGFIDPHTHFDAQLLWDGQARPALEHGVTTIVPGNCSLSLAPLKVADRRQLVGMFRQIEELPDAAFEEGFTWSWESFDGYLDAIRARLGINVAPLVGHSVLRLWVMGAASQQRAANSEEIRQMQNLLRACLDAGAVGLSTSFVDVDEHLQPVPSRWAHVEELEALAAVLGEHGRMLQVVPEFYNTDITIARVDQLADYSLNYGIPTTFSPLFDSVATPNNVTRVLRRVEEQFARGARVWPQVQTRPIDISFCFGLPSLFFGRLPRWFRVMRLRTDEKLQALRDPDTVAKLLDDAGPDGGAAVFGRLRIRSVPGGDLALVGRLLVDVAGERGITPARCLIELSLEHDLEAHFVAADMGHDVAARVGPMLAHPFVHIGASDGGAHIASFATYGDTGYLFSKFVREAHSLSLEAAVKKITSDTASIWGLNMRGLLRRGYAADVVVFDPNTIARADEVAVHDVPGGGMRYIRGARGVQSVLVNGELAFSAASGYTDARSGEIAPLN